ncbi:MAG: IgGFc-binding protein [Paludibacteraceae bacterium]
MNKHHTSLLRFVSAHLHCALLAGVCLFPVFASAQTVSTEGTSTEGKDFYITFLQADQDPNNELQLSLSISSRTDCEVTISNPFTNYSEVVPVTAGGLKLVEIYKGNVLTNNARSNMATTGKVCYAVNSEKVDTCALHVTSTAPIALFATNYKRATFDATNVIPTSSLLDSYVIQTYTPSDHGGVNATQGSHFAIVAAENNTIVDYCPTVRTSLINAAINHRNQGYTLTPEEQALCDFQVGDTLTTPVLMKGQVYYVWTGKADGAAGDLSGTCVKARDGKKIAVFQGCPHTNIPYQKKQRDHIFSQAMPTQYWGNTFALTASKNRKRDIIRIMALNDGTEVRINGVLQHTFDFVNGNSNDKKHFFEFEIGEAYGSLTAPLVADKSCLVETSCPCAVHLFMVSQQYDGDKNNNGDPAMLWVNPIEQQIDQVTFATYASSNGTTNHYTNIVTDKPELMTLDGVSIAADFAPVAGSSTYYFAQKSLGTVAETHTLKSNGSNFIAHVYGFTENESYGYSAGGATKPLTSAITINGKEFTAESNNLLCGTDTIHFGCELNYKFEKIVWGFGDGSANWTDNNEKDSTISARDHYYAKDGIYDAYALIYRTSSNLCEGQSAMDSIPIKVNIGRFTFSIGEPEIPCDNGIDPWIGKIPFNNESGTDLEGEGTTIEFDQTAQAAGFQNSDLVLHDNYFAINIPDGAAVGTPYGIHLVIKSDCGGTDTTMYFQLNYDADVLSQRAGNVLGLLADPFANDTLSDFQWYSIDANGDTIAVDGQVSATLNWYDTSFDKDNTYFVCFWRNKGTSKAVKTCTCDKAFLDNTDQLQFAPDSAIQISQQNTAAVGERIFVNATIASTLTWITIDGDTYAEEDIPAGGRTVAVPNREGFYVLRVATVAEKKKDVKTRNFKFLVTK